MEKRTGRPKKSLDVDCTCVHCGIAYKVPEWRVGGRKYCSRACVDAASTGARKKNSADLVTYNCEQCHKDYQQPPWKQTGKNYCSNECYWESRKGKVSKRGAEDTCTCLHCGLFFKVPSWKKVGRSYCSRDCYHAARVGTPLDARRIVPTPVTCEVCGEVFLTGGRNRKPLNTKFCSSRCTGLGTSKAPPLRHIDELHIAWLAGIFDGEGNIAWPRKNNVHAIRMNVTSTCYPLLEKIIELTGTGSIVDSQNYKQNPKWSQAWHWACHGENARILLKALHPWLIVKKHNAAVVLEAVAEWEQTGKTSKDYASQLIYPRLRFKTDQTLEEPPDAVDLRTG